MYILMNSHHEPITKPTADIDTLRELIQDSTHYIQYSPEAIASVNAERVDTTIYLPNGAELLKQKHNVVLAYWCGREYVTWNIYKDDLSTTCNGHYFDDYDQAALDFELRS